MATKNEVITVLEMLVDANLSYPPRDIRATAGIWMRLLGDIPAHVLNQAALDIILTQKVFPKLSEVREAAKKVGWRAGRSTAPDYFEDPTRTWRVLNVDWMAQVTPRGWLKPVVETFQQRAETAFDQECARLEAKYYDSGLPSDEEFERLERLRGGSKE